MAPGDPEGALYHVKVGAKHESNPGGPIRGQSGPNMVSRGPPRAHGHFGPKRALLGPPGAQKGPGTRSKCVVSMIPTQTCQSEAVETKSGSPGPSVDLRGPQKGHFGQKRALLGPPGAQKCPIPGQSWW